jgi:hypothetical protein
MEQQNSQKTGVRSEAQKLDRARNGYQPLPASKPAGGAFGKEEDDRPDVEGKDVGSDNT